MRKVIFLLIILLPLKIYPQCRSFDGIENTIEIQNESNFDFIDVNKSFTIECWVYPTADTGYLMHKGLPGSPYTSWLVGIINIGGYRFYLNMYDGTTQIRAYPNFILALGQWYHLALVYDGSNNYTGATFYVDGLEYATLGEESGANSIATDNPIYFGSSQGVGNFWQGRLDEPRIWNYERTEAQIISNMDKVFADEKDGLVGYWGMDESTGGVFDSTENNNHSAAIVGTLSVDNAPIKRIIGE